MSEWEEELEKWEGGWNLALSKSQRDTTDTSAGFGFGAAAIGAVTGFATALAASVVYRTCSKSKSSVSSVEEPLL